MPSALSVAFASLTGLAVVAALVSTRKGMSRAYPASKAVASMGFIGVALASGAAGAEWSTLALGALVVSAVGDIVLGVRGAKTLLVGLSCFAVAYSVYSVAFSLHGTGLYLWATAPAGALFAAGAWLFARHRLPSGMRAAVGVYIVVIAAMLATGVAAGVSHRSVTLVCGVVLIAASDLAVARERFGSPGFANKLFGLPAYYAGQTLIALSLVG